MPTGIWGSRFRSGSGHCDLGLAVQVRQCPLGSGARGSGPAVPTKIWHSQLRSGSAHCDLELARRRRKEEEKEKKDKKKKKKKAVALIKSNNPHLAGGEYYSM